ncbi:MAG: exosortase/archaeosortase family protein [Sedimentisphaerales bacterium]|nr:exosortase/archaeosortase family protein [Sedimentisphaerales bacterium]
MVGNIISSVSERFNFAGVLFCSSMRQTSLQNAHKIRAKLQEPAAPKRRWSKLGTHNYVKISVTAVLFWYLFHREINTIVYRWVTDSSWSHGFLIPFFSLYFINQHKKEILNTQSRPNYMGLFFLICSILFYIFNIVSPSGWAYFRALSMIAALGSVVLFLGGWRLIKYTWLPISYLVFAVPLPGRIYRQITIPMRQWAATAAAGILNLVSGMEATARGVIIDMIYKGRPLEPSLNVEEACSGMRLLMAFLALGVAMAYLHHRPIWQRIVLLASTIPIAIACNIVRVTATGLIYVLIHPKYTQGLYHDALGMAMLPLAFGLYGFLAWFMSSLFINEDEVIREDIVVRNGDS